MKNIGKVTKVDGSCYLQNMMSINIPVHFLWQFLKDKIK